MCNSENNKCCLYNTLNNILQLQNATNNSCAIGCDKPFLGGALTTSGYNTRPLNFYNGITGNMISINYDGENNSSVSRIENLDSCCATCRVLNLNTDTNTYTNTGRFFTIDLNSISCIKCLQDTFVEI